MILAMSFMGIRFLNFQNFLLALVSGNDYLKQNYKILDNLNIFPIPDGDTGTNMLATYQAGVDRVQLSVSSESVKTIEDICTVMDDALFQESRGNSGFIISRFFHGFFTIIKNENVLTPIKITEGFVNGLFIVKTALLNPVEGTMVTIISSIAEIMLDDVYKNPGIDITDLLKSAIKEARKVLDKTPEMLPVLGKAGVIDSGALGFIFILEGMLAGLTGSSVVTEDEKMYRFLPLPALGNLDDKNENHTFRYCTELILTKFERKPIEEINEYLKTRGDSIAVVDDKVFKLHIHTDDPDEIIGYLLNFGKIKKSKIEDMYEQISLLSGSSDINSTCTVLSFIPGSGFEHVFAAFGVSNYILYKDELPSTGEILEKLTSIDDKNIIVLANNNNILPSVILARDKSDKNVSIIPTKNVIQGITSLYGYSENENIQNNIISMKENMDMAISLFVYKSISDTIFDGIKIKKGDYFIINENTIAAVGPDLNKVVGSAINNQSPETLGNISFYYGDTFDQSAFIEIKNNIGKINEFIELEIYYGGQFREELIVSLE